MIYVCKTEHIKTGKTHVFRTGYDYKRGDVIYPWHLRSEYPGYNENWHRVLVNVPLDSLTESQKPQLIPAERQMGHLLEQLVNAEVTVLGACLDIDYNTPRPHLFRFHIHVWEDHNFQVWACNYKHEENERGTTVHFGAGEVFSLHD